MKSLPSNPLVSIIVPTKNSERFIERCLVSIKKQTYPNIEIIVVDNHSTDNTINICEKFTKNIFQKGPERSAQVNFGVSKAKGDYVYKVDSDFVLDKKVVEECVDKAKDGYDAVVVHNTPDVSVSWVAKIRKFEVDMYKYDLTHSSARFVSKKVFEKIGGFNEKVTAGEDYDFQNKLNRSGYKTGFVEAEAMHLGEPRHLWNHLKKYFSYGRDFVHYSSENSDYSPRQLAFFRSVYFKNWKQFILHPVMALEFIVYTILKFAFGGAGYAYQKYFLRTKND